VGYELRVAGLGTRIKERGERVEGKMENKEMRTEKAK
jgi:hypothetical protein